MRHVRQTVITEKVPKLDPHRDPDDIIIVESDTESSEDDDVLFVEETRPVDSDNDDIEILREVNTSSVPPKDSSAMSPLLAENTSLGEHANDNPSSAINNDPSSNDVNSSVDDSMYTPFPENTTEPGYDVQSTMLPINTGTGVMVDTPPLINNDESRTQLNELSIGNYLPPSPLFASSNNDAHSVSDRRSSLLSTSPPKSDDGNFKSYLKPNGNLLLSRNRTPSSGQNIVNKLPYSVETLLRDDNSSGGPSGDQNMDIAPPSDQNMDIASPSDQNVGIAPPSDRNMDIAPAWGSSRWSDSNMLGLNSTDPCSSTTPTPYSFDNGDIYKLDMATGYDRPSLKSPDLPKLRCVSCDQEIFETSAKCFQGHLHCKDCMEKTAKELMSGLIRNSKCRPFTCTYLNCCEQYSQVELERVLPSMIVEMIVEHYEEPSVVVDKKFLMSLYHDDPGDDSQSATENENLEQKFEQQTHCSLPEHWKPMDPNTQGYEEVDLDSDSEEYLKVFCQFHETLHVGVVEIKTIKRIQNPRKWEYFCIKKKEMKLANDGVDVLEKFLFHGTKKQNIKAICINNFDWRRSGTNGTAFGKGSYFAVNASYSHRYTDTTVLNPTRLHYCQICDKTTNFPEIVWKQLVLSKLLHGLPSNQAYTLPPPPILTISGATDPVSVKATVKGNTQSISLRFASDITSQPSTSGQQHSTISSQTDTSSSTNGSIPSQIPPPISAIPTLTSSAHTSQPSVSGQTSLLTGNDPLMGQGSVPGPASQKYKSLLSMNNNEINGILEVLKKTHKESKRTKAKLQRSMPYPNPFPRRSSMAFSVSDANARCQCAELQEVAQRMNLQDSNEQDSNSKFMFMPRVLVGEHAMGRPEYCVAPPIDHTEPLGRCFDSCVDNVMCPRIYVVFYSEQSYPEYLIEYKSLL